jgi:hypothetical protein
MYVDIVCDDSIRKVLIYIYMILFFVAGLL